jgi:hypothetical protein
LLLPSEGNFSSLQTGRENLITRETIHFYESGYIDLLIFLREKPPLWSSIRGPPSCSYNFFADLSKCVASRDSPMWQPLLLPGTISLKMQPLLQ